jgi:hypothetical protein
MFVIPDGWTASSAGGYGNFTRLTHDRCGHYTNVDVVLDERTANQFIGDHECEDLREEREDREAQDKLADAHRTATERELADLRTRVNELAGKLAEVVAAKLPRLLVLDATTPGALNKSVDALSSDDFVALAASLDTAHYREHQRDVITHIRSTLDNQPPDNDRWPIGVLLSAEKYHHDHRIAERGTVLFDDATTTTLTFDEAGETLHELYDNVDPHSTLAVDLRTDTFDYDYRGTPKLTIHQRFGLAEPEPSDDDRILATVRTTLAGDWEPDCNDQDLGVAVGVQFKARQEEDGYYLSSDDGLVLFSDGEIVDVTFPGIAAVFATSVGCVGALYTLSVDLREGSVIRIENDLIAMAERFGPHNRD